MASDFDILVVSQRGRIEHEAALFAASLRMQSPGFSGRLYVAEPQPGPLWPDDPRMSAEVRAIMERLDATPLPFDSTAFGTAYPHGNKVEAMAALTEGRPTVFFDSDTLITGEISELDLGAAPTASMRRENTWPKGPEAEAVWRDLYIRFGLDFDASVAPADDWTRFLYFNAGLVYAPEPRAFAADWLRMMTVIRESPPEGQPLYPWLDQIALPLAILANGGGRPSGDFTRLDGALSRHYRKLPLLFATADDATLDTLARIAAPNWLKKVLKRHEPFHRFLYRGDGAQARRLFDRSALPETEQPIRRKLRDAGLWIV